MLAQKKELSSVASLYSHRHPIWPLRRLNSSLLTHLQSLYMDTSKLHKTSWSFLEAWRHKIAYDTNFGLSMHTYNSIFLSIKLLYDGIFVRLECWGLARLNGSSILVDFWNSNFWIWFLILLAFPSSSIFFPSSYLDFGFDWIVYK